MADVGDNETDYLTFFFRPHTRLHYFMFFFNDYSLQRVKLDLESE